MHFLFYTDSHMPTCGWPTAGVGRSETLLHKLRKWPLGNHRHRPWGFLWIICIDQRDCKAARSGMHIHCGRQWQVPEWLTAPALKRHQKESKDATVTSTAMPVKDTKESWKIFLGKDQASRVRKWTWTKFNARGWGPPIIPFEVALSVGLHGDGHCPPIRRERQPLLFSCCKQIVDKWKYCVIVGCRIQIRKGDSRYDVHIGWGGGHGTADIERGVHDFSV